MKASRVIGKLLGFTAVTTGILFIIYMYNLDMKLVGFIYKFLGKHYDEMDRDRKL